MGDVFMNNQPRDASKDVHSGAATVVYCKVLKGYPLPGHTDLKPRIVKTSTAAARFAEKINIEMGN